MPNIVGRSTKSSANPYNTGAGSGFRPSGFSGGGNYPASESYQRALDSAFPGEAEERRRERDAQSRYRAANPRPTNLRGAGGQPRPFDVPSNNLPVPYGRAGSRALSLLSRGAKLHPGLRYVSTVADILFALGPRPGEEAFPGIPQFTHPTDGWQMTHDCPGCARRNPGSEYLQARSLASGCYNNQFWGSSTFDPTQPYCHPGGTIFALRVNSLHNGCNRFAWRRMVAQATCIKFGGTHPGASQPAYKWANQLDPMSVPIGKVVDRAPKPTPWTQIPDLADEDQVRRRSNGPGVRPWKRGGTRPSREVGVSIKAGDKPGPPRAEPPRRTRTDHRERRPQLNERETKRRAGGPLGRLLRQLADQVTEGMDVVNAAYDALPDRHRIECEAFDGNPRRSNQNGRIKAVYNFLNEPFRFRLKRHQAEYAQFIGEFLGNYALNGLEDALIGKGASYRQAVYEQVGRDAGLPDPVKWASKKLVRDSTGIEC